MADVSVADRGTQDPIAAGKELRVDSVLEGSVQKLHQRIRVTVRLIRISDRSLLWAETLDEESADTFSLQDSISEKVVKALAVRLSTPEQEQIANRYTQNGEAYQLYQKGRYFWNKRTADGLTKSIEFLEQATQKIRITRSPMPASPTHTLPPQISTFWLQKRFIQRPNRPPEERWK